MKKFLIGLIIAAGILPAAWLIVVPEQLIKGLIEQSVSGDNMSLEAVGFRKGLFFNIFADKLELTKAGAVLVTVENMEANLNPLYLLLLKAKLSFSGEIGGGRVSGTAEAGKGKNRLKISLAKAAIEDIPFFAVIGLKGRGLLSGEMRLRDGNGEVRFALEEVLLEGNSFYGVPAPLSSFRKAKGMIDVTPGVVNVSSLAFEGEGIYARLKGRILNGSAMDLILEVMPEASFADRSFLLAMLQNYKVSPGYYAIPIKGEMSF